MSRLEGVAIMIVDDEAFLREVLGEILSMEGATVTEADGAHTAIKQLERGSIDFIMSDVSMPSGSGIELLQYLQSLPDPRPPVFLYSGGATLTRDQARALGAEDLFAKPIDEQAIIKAIAAVMARRP